MHTTSGQGRSFTLTYVVGCVVIARIYRVEQVRISLRRLGMQLMTLTVGIED